MNSERSVSLRIGAAALIVLVALQIAWHCWFLPPAKAQLTSTLALSVVPLLPGLWVCTSNLRRGVLIGGIVCLFYFCHGVSVAYSDVDARLPALAEIALTLVVISASGWDARKYKKKGPKAEG